MRMRGVRPTARRAPGGAGRANRPWNSANVIGSAPSSPVMNRQARPSRSKNAASSPSVRLYGTAADDRLARVEEQVQQRHAAPHDLPRQRDHVLGRAVRRPQPAHVRDAARAAAHACVVYGTGARPYKRSSHAGTRRLSAAEIGSSSTLARAGSRRVVVGEEIRRERRADEVRARLVRLVEQRRDARVDEIARALERRDVRRRKAEAARSVRHGRARQRRR